MYEIEHLTLGVIYLLFGTLGGFYSLKTLNWLRKSPEMLKTQRGIWLPILIGTIFFSIGGLLHIAEHSFLESAEIGLLHEIFIVAGLSAFVMGVLRYSQMQGDYYAMKNEGLKIVQSEEMLQSEPQEVA